MNHVTPNQPSRFGSRLRRGAAALALAATLPLPLAGAALAAPHGAEAAPAVAPASPAAATLHLPRPTGPYTVGRDTLHLTDKQRRDPWVPSAGARELMASLYYPARPGTGHHRAPYLTADEARLLLQGIHRADVLPAAALAATRTHARTDARPDGAGGHGRPGSHGKNGFHGMYGTDGTHGTDRSYGKHTGWRYSAMIDTRRIGVAGTPSAATARRPPWRPTLVSARASTWTARSSRPSPAPGSTAARS
ncbi:hypothetical protein [Streptomyces platensis]